MYFGGVEGGATHSNLVICDENGVVVGKATGPGTNHWTLGIDECAQRILMMVRDAKENAGLRVDQPLNSLFDINVPFIKCKDFENLKILRGATEIGDAMYDEQRLVRFGLTLSGCEQDSSNAELAACVREKDPTCARAIYVGSDTAGSLFTGAPDGGMVLIAGTGSNALLRTPGGEQHGCGGWGYLLGDEGGAYWIAHKAVKMVIDDVDGLRLSPHPTHRVWEVIKEHFNADTRADLLPHAYKDFNKSQFAGVTSKLSALAYQGDELSRHIFASAGGALASHAAALARRCSAPRLRVVCVGSVWRSWDVLKPGMLSELVKSKVKTELELVRLRVSSAMGAAWLAARHIDYELPRDDSAFCQVFYTYHPEEMVNGKMVNGKINGTVQNGVESCGCGDWS